MIEVPGLERPTSPRLPLVGTGTEPQAGYTTANRHYGINSTFAAAYSTAIHPAGAVREREVSNWPGISGGEGDHAAAETDHLGGNTTRKASRAPGGPRIRSISTVRRSA